MIDKNRFPIAYLPEPAFENAEYQIRITHTVSTDKRIMSFIDTLWGFEVTGGYDQFEPLTVIGVRRSGYAFRAGIRVDDRIVRINDTYADILTLKEAQLLIRESGKQVRIYVQGEADLEDDEYTVDFWFKPPRRIPRVDNKWPDTFPWNDRKKITYKESNCFMVHSKAEEKIIERMLMGKGPIVVTESTENVVDKAADIAAAAEAARRTRLASIAELPPMTLVQTAATDSVISTTPTTTTTTTTNTTGGTTANNTTSVDTLDKGR